MSVSFITMKLSFTQIQPCFFNEEIHLDTVFNILDKGNAIISPYVYDREKLILLEIQIPDDFGIEERFGWEAISRSTIPAEYIKIVDFEGKKDFNRK